MSETMSRARPVREDPVLPAPPELAREPGRLAFLYGLATDPLALWTREHFEVLALAKKGVLGDTVTFSDPAAIRHVLVDNWPNYRKDRIQQNILRPLLGDSVLNAEGESWKRQRRIMAPLFTPRRIAAFEIDAIRDRVEVVLKPMQGLLAGARGYAGTTLLGDGQVLLVLDVKEIMP